MSLINSLLLLLAGAHLLGHLSTRLRQPALAGHMVAGILLGPSLLGWLTPGPTLSAISDIAVLIVVMTAGLEVRTKSILEAFRGRGAIGLAIGFLLPAAAGASVAATFSLAPIPMLVVALCIAVTALPVALQILGSFSLLRTRIAHVAISSALLADILVFMILGVLIELTVSEHTQSIGVSVAISIAKLLGLIAIIAFARIGLHAIQHWGRRRMVPSANSVNITVVHLALILLFVLALGSVSEFLGFHFAIGAFFAAMMITPEIVGTLSFERLTGTCETLAAAFFGPLFLAYQGLQFQVQSLAKPGFFLTLIAVAVIAKLISGYVLGRLQRMSRYEAWGLGVVMNARGVMELVVASIAFRAGLIDQGIFSALLIVGLVTTVLTPIMLQRWQAFRVVNSAAAEPAQSP